MFNYHKIAKNFLLNEDLESHGTLETYIQGLENTLHTLSIAGGLTQTSKRNVELCRKHVKHIKREIRRLQRQIERLEDN